MIAAYIHTGAKVGVLVEVGRAARRATVANEEFKQACRVTSRLQNRGRPSLAVARDQVPADVLAKERGNRRRTSEEQTAPGHRQNRRRQAGKVSTRATACSIRVSSKGTPKSRSKEHVGSIAKQLGDEIVIRRFVRFQVGEVQPGALAPRLWRQSQISGTSS